MKKRIGSKVYDIASARLIGKCDNNKSSSDLAYSSQSLYRKKTNEYFLYTYDGEMSPNNMVMGVSSDEREFIKPISYDEAMCWIKEHNIDVDERLINNNLDTSTKKRIEFFAEAKMKNELDNLAKQRNISLSKLIRIALQEYIEKNN